MICLRPWPADPASTRFASPRLGISKSIVSSARAVLSSILLKEPLGPKMTLDSAKSQINEIVCRENKLTGHSTVIPHGTNAFERFNVFENANAR